MNGARLSEVHQDHVVLTRGSLAATLYLYQKDPRAAKTNNLNALTMVGAEPSKPLRIEKINEGLTDYLRPSPVYDGDVLRGYQVYPGPRAGVFSRLGLQAGDVLTSINDTPLSEPAAALEMLTQIMRGVAVVATIERKHARQRITLDGAVISADQEQAKESPSAAMPLAGLPTS